MRVDLERLLKVGFIKPMKITYLLWCWYIEAIQQRRKIIFDKRNKRRALEPGMMVMMQDARKMDFPGKFDALWLRPYVMKAVFLNNSLQLENIKESVQAIPSVTNTICMLNKRIHGVQSRMIANYISPKLWLIF